MTPTWKRWLLIILIAALAATYYVWDKFGDHGLPAGIAGGNGRIEAVEIDISTKIPGRIKEILDIRLDRPRDYRVKTSPAFVAYKERATEIIREESMKLLQTAVLSA